MKRIALLAILVALPGTTMLGCSQRQPTYRDNQGIAIPSYFDPDHQWTSMEQAYPTVGLVIINPDSGPGSSKDTNYANQVQRSRMAGLLVLGYVPTWYADLSEYPTDTDQPTPTTKLELLKIAISDINKYYTFYPELDGIFLDQVPDICVEITIQYDYIDLYYKILYDEVKKKKGIVVLNPGTQTEECYMAISDIIINFEGSYFDYTNNYPQAPSWVSQYHPSRFWHLVYDTPFISDMTNAIILSKERHAGWVYVTPDQLPNQWDTIPTGQYWTSELATVQSR